MIIDAHCHLVPTVEGVQVTKERMREAGVSKTVVVPGGMVPLLGLGDYLRGRAPLELKEPRNDFNLETVRSNPDSFAAMFHFDPNYHDAEDADEAIQNGFVGFKLNPLVDKLRFEHESVVDMCHVALKKDVPVYSHITHSGGASLEALEQLLSRFPKLTLILGHMGFASSDAGAIALAARYENVYLETSVGSFHAIKEAVRRLSARKLVFGSEGPAHHPATELMKIQLLKLPDADFEQVTGGNMAALIFDRVDA